ncbi:amidohydrolase family protein [Nocardioides speluncae]|uniref:amidohydrolase family protein n=1 Tax=Nocardioides speluncae TaxID=2670337 RepID=UPI000D695474|nr:amidohydrolase family protein [Nocardioides speluncae]
MHAWRARVAFDGERFLDGGATVLVEGEEIVGVEPAAYDVPHDCAVTEFEGTLLPGLFDCHVHLVADGTVGGLERVGEYDDATLDRVIVESLSAQVAMGVTTVRDLGDTGYRTLAHRLDPGLPRVVAAGPPLTVPDGHCHFLGGVVTADGIKDAIAEHADRGVDVVKVMASGGMLTPGTDVLGIQFDPAELRQLVEIAHDLGLSVLAHAHSLAGIQHAIAAGVDGIEHFTGLTAEGVQLPDAVLSLVAAGGIVVDPTLGTDLAKLAEIGEPPPAIKAVMERLGLDPMDMFEGRIALLSRFREYDVRLVTGTDAGIGPPKQHGNAWLAVMDLVRGGYPVDEALATATSGAADACDLTGITGRMAPDHLADLLAVDGDLRTDPNALGRPATVMVRGLQG